VEATGVRWTSDSIVPSFVPSAAYTTLLSPFASGFRSLIDGASAAIDQT
jgi:hypothetical protein